MVRLGIDFGTKKIGLAITDEGGTMAFPLSVVPNDDSFMSYIQQLVAERGVKEFVVGHSLNLQGKDNPVQEHIDAFITDATLEFGLPVHLQPEQFTTQAASRVQGRNEMTDASAAALILSSYIERLQ